MNGKRTEQIAVRITPETKKILQEEAGKIDWTTAKLAERILNQWTEESKQGRGALEFILPMNPEIQGG